MIAGYTAVGLYARYWADDYCAAAVLHAQGFWEAQRYWYNEWTGKVSHTFVLALLGLAGPHVVAFLPAVVLGLWFLALAWTLGQVAAEISLLRRLALATLLLYGTVDRTPDFVQSLYWQTGMLTYTAPLLGLTLLAGLCTDPQRWPWVAGLAFVAGGFSETYATIQALAFTFALALTPSRFRPPVLAGLVGTVLVLAVIVAAPGNTVRTSLLPPHPALIPLVLVGVRRVFEALGGYLLPPFTAGALVLGTSWLVGELPIPGRPERIAGIVSLGAGLLVLGSLLPSLWRYGLAESPPSRVYVIPAFVLTCLAVFLGILLRWSHTRHRGIMLGVLLVLSVGYSLSRPLTLLPTIREYAQGWDARDQVLREAVRGGAITYALTPLPTVASLHDVAQYPPRDWVNDCVARYYRLQAVTVSP